MKKTVRLIAAALVGIFILTTSSQVAPAQAAADQTGFQFLERLVVLMIKAVAPGGGSGDIGQDIILLAKELKSTHEAKRVDDLFAIRYSRLLSAVRQGILRDPEVLYWPMYRFTMIDFIEERTGKMPEWKEILFHVNNHGGSGVGLAILADAVMSEVVSLHIHLETLAKRPEILKSYMEKGLKAVGEGK